MNMCIGLCFDICIHGVQSVHSQGTVTLQPGLQPLFDKSLCPCVPVLRSCETRGLGQTRRDGGTAGRRDGGTGLCPTAACHLHRRTLSSCVFSSSVQWVSDFSILCGCDRSTSTPPNRVHRSDKLRRPNSARSIPAHDTRGHGCAARTRSDQNPSRF